MTDNTEVEDLSNVFVETEIYVAVHNPDKDIGTNFTIGFTSGILDKYIYDG